ncbi:HAD family hydrolase [Larkinella soli]|uniref:HAD family hydrolase n=1 Tax=Larkinella soli TaxID=1770527 RepID=UPI000FFBD022|nr:HAD family phosphatase [Larkinella soli]
MLAAIFDMDGVIVDTNPHHRIAWREYYHRYGKTLSDEDFVRYVSGKHNLDILAHLFPDRALSPEEARQLAYDKEALFRELYRPHITPVPGLVAFLKALKAAGIKTAVATSAPVENLDFVMEALDLRGYFDVLLDESLVTHPKPDPEIYRKAMSLLGVEPQDAVVFEDSSTGIRAGKGSGATVIGLSTTQPAEELLAVGADEVIRDFNEFDIARFQGLSARSVSA